MILIRSVEHRDVDALLALSSTPGMFNLPSKKEDLLERIRISKESFSGKLTDIKKTKYVFVAEDLATGEAVGTSMIAGQHGTEESPHYYFKVDTEKRFSNAIQTGFIHGTLTLKTQTQGPSELGGLVVREDYRNHAEKIGRQVFLARFLYLAGHRNHFGNELIAELLPPLNKKGNSPLWEAIGRRFTNMDYWEADALAAKDKEFITDLFPKGKIYSTFLPAEAKNAIGKVGKSTEPVLHLLKKIGFRYHNEIDPFDGGPHLRAKIDDIIPVKRSNVLEVNLSKEKLTREEVGLITPDITREQFTAIQVKGQLRHRELWVDEETEKLIAKYLKLEKKGKARWIPVV